VLSRPSADSFAVGRRQKWVPPHTFRQKSSKTYGPPCTHIHAFVLSEVVDTCTSQFSSVVRLQLHQQQVKYGGVICIVCRLLWLNGTIRIHTRGVRRKGVH
jgi:hypothetical protein